MASRGILRYENRTRYLFIFLVLSTTPSIRSFFTTDQHSAGQIDSLDKTNRSKDCAYLIGKTEHSRGDFNSFEFRV